MRRLFWPLAILALAVLVVAAVLWGAVPLSPRAIAAAVAGRGDPETVAIVRALRLPRVVLAALVGAALGMAAARSRARCATRWPSRICSACRGARPWVPWWW